MKHLIYSKLASDNVMNGKLGNKDKTPFSVNFKKDKKTPVSEEEFEALMAEENSALSYLVSQGDFVIDAESATNEISSLKGEVKKLQNALKKAEDDAKLAEQKEASAGIEEAEKAFKEAEEAFKACEDVSQKKELKKVVDLTAKALKEAKKG